MRIEMSIKAMVEEAEVTREVGMTKKIRIPGRTINDIIVVKRVIQNPIAQRQKRVKTMIIRA